MKAYTWPHLLKFSAVALAAQIMLAASAQAASKVEIDLYVEDALKQFHKETTAGTKLAAQTKGMLIFPQSLQSRYRHWR